MILKSAFSIYSVRHTFSCVKNCSKTQKLENRCDLHSTALGSFNDHYHLMSLPIFNQSFAIDFHSTDRFWSNTINSCKSYQVTIVSKSQFLVTFLSNACLFPLTDFTLKNVDRGCEGSGVLQKRFYIMDHNEILLGKIK